MYYVLELKTFVSVHTAYTIYFIELMISSTEYRESTTPQRLQTETFQQSVKHNANTGDLLL